MGSSTIEIKDQEYYHYSNYKSQQVLVGVLLCSIIVLIMMSVCLTSSYWITTDGFRQGILFLCIEEQDLRLRGDSLPLPFDLSKEGLAPGCYPNRDVGYLRLCTCLCTLTQLAALACAFFTGCTLAARGSKKINSLKLAICTTLAIILCDIALVIIYPMQFAKEIDKSNRDLWELNSAYGLACGVAMLATGLLIVLLIVLQRITTAYKSLPARI